MSLYSSYYAVPLLSQGWPALATYASDRMAHFAELHAGVSAVYDRGANTVTVTSPCGRQRDGQRSQDSRVYHLRQRSVGEDHVVR